MLELYDKKGRAIKVGDLLKIYHFTAAKRRQKKYIYKLVVRECENIRHDKLLTISHMNKHDETFFKLKDGKIWEECEIIQGFDDIDKRPIKI